MTRHALFVVSLALLPLSAFSQEPQPTPALTPGTSNTWNLDWDGISGRTYFIQHSDNLIDWQYFPIIESGAGQSIGWGFTSSAERFFVRLRYTDEPTSDPDNDDFDNDGLSNWDDLSLYNTDPFNKDTDGDTLLDGWEVANGLDATDDGTIDPNNGPTGDPDGDGSTNEQEQENETDANDPDSDDDGVNDGDEATNNTDPNDPDSDDDGLTDGEEEEQNTDPNDPDSDDDGITDGGEIDQGTDPNDPDDTPEAEWFILTGDLDEDEEKARNRTVNIPAGESRVIVVLVASDEYPDYTGQGSEFNDTLSWNVRPDGLAPLTGNIDVNSRHTHWEQAETIGRELNGFSPVHVEDAMAVNAPNDAPLAVQIDLTATNIGDAILPSSVLVGLLPAAFKAKEGRIHEGFDPVLSAEDQFAWASVTGGKTADHIEFHCPDADELKISFELQEGENALSIEPGHTTGDATSVNLIGVEVGTRALVTVAAKFDDHVIKQLKVWVLPQKEVAFTLHRVTDPDSAGTSPVGGPTNQEVLSTLNEVFHQAGIRWNLANATDEQRRYDVNDSSRFEITELPLLDPRPSQQGAITVIVLKRLGLGEPARVLVDDTVIVGATYTSAPNLVIAHELGHVLDLPDKDDGTGHDPRPWPDDEESLMRPGPGSGEPPSVIPGKWLRQEDWIRANDYVDQLFK